MQNRVKTRNEQLLEIRTGRDLDELLRELYVDQGRTQQEIAEAIGVHRVTVHYWLKRAGVVRPERPPLEITA